MRKESDLPSIIADREKGLVKRGSRINSILKKISFFSKENGEKSDPAVSDSVEEEKHISFSAEDSEEPEVHTVNLLSSDSEKSAPADKEGKDPSTEDLSKLNGVSTESGAAVKPYEQSEPEAGEKGAKKVHVVFEQQSVAEEDVHKANPDVPQEPEYVSTSAHEEGELKNAKSNSQPIENVVIPGDTGLRLVPVPLEDPPSVTQPKAQSTQDTEARAMDLKAEDIVPEVDSHSEPHLDRQKEDALINEVPVIPEFLLLSDEARVDPPEQEDTELTCGKNGYVGSEKPESVETRKEEATNSMRDEDSKRNEGNTPEPYRSEPDIHQEQEPSHEHDSREQQWGEPDKHHEQESSHEYESHDQQWGEPDKHQKQEPSHEYESHDQEWGVPDSHHEQQSSHENTLPGDSPVNGESAAMDGREEKQESDQTADTEEPMVREGDAGAPESISTSKFEIKRNSKELKYGKTMRALQRECVKLQQSVVKNRERVVIIFEGLELSGKFEMIRKITKYMDPRSFRHVSLNERTAEERDEWFFQRYSKHLPKPGEIVFFNRSWYERAVTDPVHGLCTEEEFGQFLVQAPEFEFMLLENGYKVIKIWLDVSKKKQKKRLKAAFKDPLKDWNATPFDDEYLERWKNAHNYRDLMFSWTSKKYSPWIVVNADRKKRARLETIRYLLTTLDYEGKEDAKISLIPDGSVVRKFHRSML